MTARSPLRRGASLTLLASRARAGSPGRSARVGPAGSPAPSSRGTSVEPCRRTLPALVGAPSCRCGGVASFRFGMHSPSLRAACRLRPARLFAARWAPRLVASDDRRRDAVSRRAALLGRGAASCSVSRWRFDESARRASAYGAAPRSRCRLVCRAASSRAWRRSSRLLCFGGCVVVLRAFPRGTARLGAPCASRDFSFSRSPGGAFFYGVHVPGSVGPPRHPRGVPGTYAVAAGCRSRASGRDRTRSIPRLCRFGPARRSSVPSPLAGAVSLKVRRFGAVSDRRRPCSWWISPRPWRTMRAVGMRGVPTTSSSPALFAGPPMRTWRRRPAVTGRPVRRLLGNAFQRLSLSGDMISAPRVYVHTFFLPNSLPNNVLRPSRREKSICERPPQGGRSQGAK